MGALLVVMAAVLTYVGYLGATAAPTQSYVVAARTLSQNDQVGAAHFRVVTGELPPEVAGQTFADPRDLDGAVMLVPVTANGLVRRSDVLLRDRAESRPEAYELSFTAPSWKLDGAGRLAPGSLVDIVPTGDARGGGMNASPVVERVRVLGRTDGGSGAGDIVVTVAAADAAGYRRIIDAVRGEFWIVRSTRAPSAGVALGGTTPVPPITEAPSTSAPPSTTSPPTTGGRSTASSTAAPSTRQPGTTAP